MTKMLPQKHGGVAQLGERGVRNAEVRSSILLVSIFTQYFAFFVWCVVVFKSLYLPGHSLLNYLLICNTRF